MYLHIHIELQREHTFPHSHTLLMLVCMLACHIQCRSNCPPLQIVPSPPDLPLLFPCGSIRKDTLPVKLKSHGFPLNEVVCYECISWQTGTCFHCEAESENGNVYGGTVGIECTWYYRTLWEILRCVCMCVCVYVCVCVCVCVCMCVCVCLKRSQSNLCWISGLLSKNALSEQWGKKPVFVVGGATANAVRSLGLSPQGEKTGQADKLANLVIQSSKHPIDERTPVYIHNTLCNTRFHMHTHTLIQCLCDSCMSHTYVQVKLPSTPNSAHPSEPPSAVPLWKH